MADSTINGLTALTGANVDNTADQFAIWDNSDSTTKKITRTELLTGIPAGTAAAPAISFTGDATTGIYAGASSRISFATAGTLRAYMSPNGIFNAATGTAAAPCFSFAGDTNTGLLAPAADTFAITTGGSERLRIDSSGQVGIGTASPSSFGGTATIVGASTSGILNIWSNDAGGGANVGGSIQLGGNDGATSTRGYTAIRGYKENATSGDYASYLAFATRANGGSLTERMRITSAGNVLVNTAAVATTATDGFLYVPTCAGTPTGTPTTYTGRSPIVIDSTNNKLYFYSGGAWRDAGP